MHLMCGLAKLTVLHCYTFVSLSLLIITFLKAGGWAFLVEICSFVMHGLLATSQESIRP